VNQAEVDCRLTLGSAIVCAVVESQELCPLCGELLSEPTNNDHVFGQAFGGRVTVRTHERCNSNLGNGPERVLGQEASVMNLVRAFNRLAKKQVPGVMPDGTPVTMDIQSGRMTPRRPTARVEHNAETVSLYASGSEGQVRGVVDDWRSGFGTAIPTYDELPTESRSQITGSPTEVTSTQELDLEAAEGFAIKVALDAGLLAFGPTFPNSTVAVALREWRDAPFDNPLESGPHRLRMDLRALNMFDRNLRGYISAEAAESQAPLTPRPATKTNSVAFVPSSQRTVVFVHALSFPLPPYGIVIEAELPSGEFGRQIGPVVVREDDQRWRVTNWTEVIFENDEE
jgi:hypothetical protein